MSGWTRQKVATALLNLSNDENVPDKARNRGLLGYRLLNAYNQKIDQYKYELEDLAETQKLYKNYESAEALKKALEMFIELFENTPGLLKNETLMKKEEKENV